MRSASDKSERLAQAAMSSGLPMAILSPAGKTEWVNEAFSALTEFELEDVTGRDLFAVLRIAEQAPRELSKMQATLALAEGGRFRFPARTRSAGRLFIEIDVRVLPAPGGFVLCLTNITDLRRNELRLEAVNSALRSAGNMAKVGAWDVDMRTRQTRWSLEVQTLLGRAEIEEVITSLEAYHPEDRDRVHKLFFDCVLSGAAMDFEARSVNAEGAPIWLHVIGAPEFELGVCTAIRGAIQDITAKKAAQETVLESERFAMGVIDGVSAYLAVIDGSGAIIAANRAFRTLGSQLRGSEEYTFGGNMFAILAKLPGKHGTAMIKGIREVLSGKRETFMRAYNSKSGEWFRATVSRFAGEGPVRAIIATQSIAELKRGEERLRRLNVTLKAARDQAEAANIAKSTFLATMSHEIRTPLNGVLGMAQAMARDELPPIQRERLSVIRQSGETLLALLNDLLDLARIEAGRLELEDSVVNVETLVQGAGATFATLAVEKDLHFEHRVDPNVAGLWRGDPTRVRQILNNLVSNAVKFTSRGSVVVEVGLEAGELVAKVSDTGPGIPADRLSALFGKFIQADASTTRKFGGSGLGLSICKELAQLMGGTIAVESTEGVGSTFTLRLPAERADAAEHAVAEEPPRIESDEDAPPLRILAAEDNPMNQLVLKTLLAQFGVQVQIVGDGAQAVAAAKDGEWDVILMDVQMPVMDGPTAARAIREHEARACARRTPIIALTANAMSHHQREYLAAGMDAMVPKPIELARLIDAIEQVTSPTEATNDLMSA
ncbi:MAG: ATP-binding protein [Caulobacteraceae bacterium]